VLFGLSTDYEVYLVSRIQEEWQRLNPTRSHHLEPSRPRAIRHNQQAITTSQAKSGKIIAGAATIMVLVFGSFLLSGDRILQEFGFGLAFAVLVDALIIRSLLVPAIMHRFGPANRAMPARLDRIVPNLSIEAGDDPPDTPLSIEAGGDPSDTPGDEEPLAVPAGGDEPTDAPAREALVGVSSPTAAEE
jgi:putative drug exporter of the RND superfamily